MPLHAPVGNNASAVDVPRANDHIGAAVDGVNEPRQDGRWVLAIGVHADQHLSVCSVEPTEDS